MGVQGVRKRWRRANCNASPRGEAVWPAPTPNAARATCSNPNSPTLRPTRRQTWSPPRTGARRPAPTRARTAPWPACCARRAAWGLRRLRGASCPPSCTDSGPSAALRVPGGVVVNGWVRDGGGGGVITWWTRRAAHRLRAHPKTRARRQHVAGVLQLGDHFFQGRHHLEHLCEKARDRQERGVGVGAGGRVHPTSTTRPAHPSPPPFPPALCPSG